MTRKLKEAPGAVVGLRVTFEPRGLVATDVRLAVPMHAEEDIAVGAQAPVWDEGFIYYWRKEAGTGILYVCQGLYPHLMVDFLPQDCADDALKGQLEQANIGPRSAAAALSPTAVPEGELAVRFGYRVDTAPQRSRLVAASIELIRAPDPA